MLIMSAMRSFYMDQKLYLEGATWHSKRHTLDEAAPKQLFSEMNVIHLKPTDEPPTTAAKAGAYDCPLYQTTSRSPADSLHGHARNFVTFVRLPSEASEAHWIKRGAALLCNLDD